jgi:plasmid stabilization system protein ParE
VGKKLRILVLPQAAEDLRAIYEPLYSEILHRIRLLSEFPQMGKALPAATPGWRATVVGIFRIIYRIKPRGLEIAFVRHCRREDPELED